MSNEWVDDFGQILTDVHDLTACWGGNCTIHNPSNHRMRAWKQRWRVDRHFFERVCEHGVGHPDPDEILNDERALGIHGCDRCCWPLDIIG